MSQMRQLMHSDVPHEARLDHHRAPVQPQRTIGAATSPPFGWLDRFEDTDGHWHAGAEGEGGGQFYDGAKQVCLDDAAASIDSARGGDGRKMTDT